MIQSSQRFMFSPERSHLIADCIRTAARNTRLDEVALLQEIEAAIGHVQRPGTAKRDQKRWVDDCTKSLADIYVQYTGRRVGFTNGETETRFERFVRLVIVAEGQDLSRNLVKAAIRRFNLNRSRDKSLAVGLAAE